MPRFTVEQYEVLKEYYDKDPDWSPATISTVWKVFLQKFGKEYVQVNLSRGKVYKWGYDNKARNLRKKFRQYNMDKETKFSTKVCLRKPVTLDEVKEGAIVDFNKEVTNLLTMVDRPISSALHELEALENKSESESALQKTDSLSTRDEAPIAKPKIFKPIPLLRKLEDSCIPYHSLGRFLSSFSEDSGLPGLGKTASSTTGYIMIARDLKTGKVLSHYQICSLRCC